MGAFSYCETSAYIDYCLGLKADDENGWVRPKPGRKGDFGNALHKALEFLAHRKLAEQEGRPGFTDDETGLTFGPGAPDLHEAVEASWEHHRRKLPHWDWTEADRENAHEWAKAATTMSGGAFNPLSREVLWPERRFDIEMPHDWARYEYEIPGWPKVEGRLCLKGTVDLVCKVSDDVIELQDWKTGQAKDWATGRRKDFKYLMDDFQLRLYHYALCKVVPWARQVIVTILYLRDGGATSLPYSRSDLPETEDMIRRKFEAMRDCEKPRLAWDSPGERFKCERLCVYHANKWAGTNKTVCRHITDELVQLGMPEATRKYGSLARATSYGSGGGRTA